MPKMYVFEEENASMSYLSIITKQKLNLPPPPTISETMIFIFNTVLDKLSNFQFFIL